MREAGQNSLALAAIFITMQVLRNLARTRACLALAVCFLAAHVQAQSPLKGITYSPFWENAEQFCRPQQASD